MLNTVGFDSSKNLSHVHYAIASSISSITTRFVTQPFDVIKIRFQLQVEPISKVSKSSKYKGFNHALKTIFKEEGITALWKGHMPGQLLSIFYGVTQFVTFEYLTKIAYKNLYNQGYKKINKTDLHDLNNHASLSHPEYSKSSKIAEPESQIFIHLVCGSLSGCFATTITFPFDVIRTYLILQGTPKVYNGIYDAAKKVIKKEGVRGFYKGIVPSLMQIMPFSGLIFCLNRLFKQLWPSNLLNRNNSGENILFINIMESTVCGAASGFTAKSIVYPLDLLKKRLQVQGLGYARKEFGAHHDYVSLIDGIKKIIKTESISGFYKGFYPSVLKSGAVTAMQFVIYEQVIQFLILYNKK